MKHISINLIALFVSISTFVTAQSPAAVLSSKDVDNYITSLKPMSKELMALGDKYSDDPTMAQMWSYTEARSILEKYGWNETYAQKWAAITVGASYLIAMEQVKDMPEEQAKSMSEMYLTQYKSMINEADIELLKPRVAELKKLFEEIGEED
jgi:hypothetical protein